MDNSFEFNFTTLDRIRYAKRVREQQMDAVYSRFIPIIITGLLLSTPLIANALWELASGRELIWWLLANLLVNAILAALYIRDRRARSRSDGTHKRGTSLVLGILALSAYWCTVLGYLYVMIPEMQYRLYVFLLWGAIGALAISVLDEHLPSFYAFLLPSAILMIGLSARESTRDYYWMATLLTLGFGGLALFAHHRNRAQTEALHLRYAMSDLAREASEQRNFAENANIAKSKFLAAASHDLRQPLHALTLLTSALHAQPISGVARDIADDIQGAVDSLARLFDALLDISKLDAGVLNPIRRHIDLGAFLQRITSEFATEATTKGLQLQCTECELVAFSDPVMLEIIVRNYLSNAIRYTSSGSINVRCSVADTNIRIEVQDSGIGIPSAQHTEIFSEFYQIGNSERDRTKGLGLGLAIVSRIAKLLEYAIGVESTPGQGSCFFVTIPLGSATLINRDATAPAGAIANLTGMRIVVIDDDVVVRESMRKLLTTWNCECVVADDEDEAVAATRRQFATIDAIIADYRLRNERSGLQAIARLRTEFHAEIPALLVSGDIAPERLRQVAESGHMLVHKPIQPQVLKVFLANTLRSLRAK